MKYVSIDIETTGLDKEHDQVLQVAMVFDEIKPGETPKPIEELPAIEVIIHQRRISGHPFALNMNKDLIETISKLKHFSKMTDYNGRQVHVVSNIGQLTSLCRNWLSNVHINQYQEKYVAAGKNAAGFDLPFLGPRFQEMFHHRVIDVGSLALGAEPELWARDVPPSLSDLVGEPVAHDALADALDVVKAIRRLVL